MTSNTDNISNTFCILPWIHITTAVSGFYKVCCNAEVPISGTFHDQRYRAGNMSLQDAFHSEPMVEVRKQMLQGKQPAVCNACWRKEKTGIRSMREVYNHLYVANTGDNTVSFSPEAHSESMLMLEDKTNRATTISLDEPAIRYLDIKFDSTCNLKCRMCSPQSSNLLQDELMGMINAKEKTPRHFGRIRSIRAAENNKHKPESFYEDVISQFPTLEIFKGTGGEPTVNPQWLRAVDYAIEKGYAQNMLLDFTTNATKFNDELLEKLQKFKKVRIRISVDGVGDAYDYIRYPFKWKQIDRRINQLFSFGREHNLIGTVDNQIPRPDAHIVIVFSVVASAYNIFNLGDVLCWLFDLFHKYNYYDPDRVDIDIDWGFIPWWSELNPIFLPKHILESAYEVFKKKTEHIRIVNDNNNATGEIEHGFYQLGEFKRIVDMYANSEILEDTQAIDQPASSHVNFSSPGFRNSLSAYLKETTAIMDKSRSQNYKELLHPEMVEYIDNAPTVIELKSSITKDTTADPMKSKTMCALPFMHLSTRTMGTMQLCCTANSSSDKNHRLVGCNRHDNGALVNVQRDSFVDAWNTEYMRNVRMQMINGVEPRECKKCFDEERHGARSKRTWENEYWLNEQEINFDKILESVDDHGNMPTNIHYIDLKLGNKCDLACIMCGPNDSSLWVPDWNKLQASNISAELQEDTDWSKGKVQGGGYNWYKNNTPFWDELYEHLPTLKNAYILGGEPTINDEFKTFLKTCVDTGHANHIELRFNTNGQTLDTELTELYTQFKKVTISFSLDVSGQQQHQYIRYPSSWEHTVYKMWEYDDLAYYANNIELTFDCTAQLFNIFRLPKFIKWKLEQNFRTINRWPTNAGLINIHFLYFPKFLNVKVLPDYAKQAVQEIYEDFYMWLEENVKLIHPDITIKHLQRGNGIPKLSALINYMWSEDLSHLLPRAREFIHSMDKVRDLSIENDLFEIHHIIEGTYDDNPEGFRKALGLS